MNYTQGLMFRLVTRIAIIGVCAVALVACGSSSDDEVTGITESPSEETDQSDLSGSSASESSSTVEESDEVVEEESDEVVEEESVEAIEESDEVVEESDEPEIIEVEANPQIEEDIAETDEGLTPEEQEALIESILLDSYLWGTGTAFKTTQLQEVLELNVDGSYGPQTRLAHLLALEERGLPTTSVPEEPTGATAPTPPINLLVAPGDSLAKLTWTASEESGGIPLVGYTATATPGGQKCETTGTSCDITGLTNGTSYTFIVTASNGEFSSDESSAVSVTPGIPNSILNNLDNCTESEDFCSSGGIKIDWSANQGLGSNEAYSYYNHLIIHYYDIGGGDGHGGRAWKNSRNVEIIDITHDGTCVQLTEFKIRLQNDILEMSQFDPIEIDDLTIGQEGAMLYLYTDGVLVGSQSLGLYMDPRTISNTQTISVYAGQTSCLDQIRIAYNITGTCDPDSTMHLCSDVDNDASLTVMTDDWTFNKWS